LYGGCLSTPTELPHIKTGLKTGRMISRLKIYILRISKQIYATESWSSYFSSMKISMDKLSGCLMDTTLILLFISSVNFMPDSSSESVTTVASLLSIDNIEVSCNGLDLLVISSSSSMTSSNQNNLLSTSFTEGNKIHHKNKFTIRSFRTGQYWL